MEQEGPTISWQVHTHEHKERTNDWYWALGLIAVVGAAISLFFGNTLFALIILIGAGSIATLVIRGPREHWIRVDNRGVSLDGTLYRYPSLQSFWVEMGDNPRLLLETTGIFSPQIVIPIENATRAQNLRVHLKRHIEEKEQEPHVGAHLAELFGL